MVVHQGDRRRLVPPSEIGQREGGVATDSQSRQQRVYETPLKGLGALALGLYFGLSFSVSSKADDVKERIEAMTEEG